MDVEQVTDIADGECVVLGREAPPHSANYAGESKIGDEGIRAIVAMDDEYVWTATGSADIKRWRDTGRRMNRGQSTYEGASYGDRPSAINGDLAPAFTQTEVKRDGEGEVGNDGRERTIAFAPPPPRANGSPINAVTASPARDRLGIPPARRTTMSGEPIAGSIAMSFLSDMSVQDHDEANGTTYGPGTLNGLPYASLVCLGQPDSPYSFEFSRGVSRTSLTVPGPENGLGSPRKQSESAAKLARLEFEDREIASEATPLRKKPDSIIGGRPGLVRSQMLNDRQHVLTVDTEGEVAAWNIIKGVCIGRFSAAEVAAALDLERGIAASENIRKHSNEVLEMVKQRVEGETMVITWCQVDTRIGSLVVHMEEGRAFDAEVYADELGLDIAGIQDDIKGMSSLLHNILLLII